MQYTDIIARLEAMGYKVADERTTPQQLKTWKLPYCAIAVGTESTEGADLRPFLRKQPALLTLYTLGLERDRAEQNKIKALLDEMAVAYTTDGEFIEDGNIYATDFNFTLIHKIKRS